MSMNKTERAKMVMAMETIARSINYEPIINSWLMLGVADGDIDENTTLDDEDVEFYYEDDDRFADLMALFLRLMRKAEANGGLYCDGVVSDRVGHLA